MGIENEPLHTELARYPDAMPQYLVGHGRRVERIESLLGRHPGLALAGNAYGGVGLPDCVRSGEQAAERVLGGAGCRPTHRTSLLKGSFFRSHTSSSDRLPRSRPDLMSPKTSAAASPQLTDVFLRVGHGDPGTRSG